MYDHELHEAHDETCSSRVTLLSGQSRSGIIINGANEGNWPTLKSIISGSVQKASFLSLTRIASELWNYYSETGGAKRRELTGN